jgi:predicted Zn-dependent protease
MTPIKPFKAASISGVKKLEPPDSHYLLAAEGWLGLGNQIEAFEELERISPQLRVHPDVLELRWQIYAKEKKWEACVDIARAIAKLAPSRPQGWIHLACSLHELKRTKEAKGVLSPVVDKFPEEPVVRYKLACYECQLGNLEEARSLLEKAFESGDANEMKLMALDDPDLEPLWNKIGELCARKKK